MNTYRYRLWEKRIRHACRYHIVWCPTFRRPVLTEPMQVRLKGLIEDVCKAQDIVILKMKICPWCVYLHADMPPTKAVNNMVRSMKRISSHVLCEEFPELCSRLPSLWTLHYFVSTEETAPEKEIEAWINTQPRFTAKKSRPQGKGTKCKT